jgi:hypothetical protein
MASSSPGSTTPNESQAPDHQSNQACPQHVCAQQPQLAFPTQCEQNDKTQLYDEFYDELHVQPPMHSHAREETRIQPAGV